MRDYPYGQFHYLFFSVSSFGRVVEVALKVTAPGVRGPYKDLIFILFFKKAIFTPFHCRKKPEKYCLSAPQDWNIEIQKNSALFCPYCLAEVVISGMSTILKVVCGFWSASVARSCTSASSAKCGRPPC